MHTKHGRAATNMRVFVCETDFTPHRLWGTGVGEGEEQLKGVKTNAVGNEMQCAKCIFRDYTIEVINHNGGRKSRGYPYIWGYVCEKKWKRLVQGM